ncbi:hypothetical protein HpBT150_05560 [Helicobacter pylori]
MKQSETQAGSREDRPLMFYPILAKKDKVKSITKDEFARIYNKETRIFNDDFLNTLKQKYNDFDFILPIKNDKNFGRWTCGFDSFLMMLENNEIMTENSKIYKKEYLQNERISKVVPFLFNETNLFNSVGTQEILALFNGTKLFDTPKPEALLQRIIEISTQENDLILDFFAGSGTTCAVAHKLKRKYIGIEMGEHFERVILPRLKKVIGGFKSGVAKEFNGGGVMKVYALESYEEILRKIKYEDNDKPLAYDEQYSDLVECKNESYTLNLNALEKMGVDIKETLENLWGLKVEFFNEKVVKFKGNDKEIEILKALKEALIW